MVTWYIYRYLKSLIRSISDKAIKQAICTCFDNTVCCLGLNIINNMVHIRMPVKAITEPVICSKWRFRCACRPYDFAENTIAR